MESGKGDFVAQARRLHDENRNDELFAFAAEKWPQTDQPLPEGISEVCRYAFRRAQGLRLSNQHLWRARALTAAVLQRNLETAAGLVQQAFFVAIIRARDGDEDGRDLRYDQAREILNEIRRLVPEGTPQWDDPWAGLYWEKRAFSYLWQATEGGRPRPEWEAALVQAEDEYQHAIDLAGDDDRRALKVRAGCALARYLRCAVWAGPDEEIAARKAECLTATEAVSSRAAEIGYPGVERRAAVNCEVLRRREFEGWDPYEDL